MAQAAEACQEKHPGGEFPVAKRPGIRFDWTDIAKVNMSTAPKTVRRHGAGSAGVGVSGAYLLIMEATQCAIN
jgi:hypothetical protein